MVRVGLYRTVSLQYMVTCREYGSGTCWFMTQTQADRLRDTEHQLLRVENQVRQADVCFLVVVTVVVVFFFCCCCYFRYFLRHGIIFVGKLNTRT